ncbi:unnamed protein product [Zymoseptoria tritici ST99CH_1A5]|uniref:Tetratricopeptide repeat protein 29 n=1 Tax=Zymoseptoria tritici ST99CH_1A5 TaxID=1276529 RepID=A0A1Y6LY17_ZYMTR|nr:unnamed protein product [Zymoseptoria tritici ST99CH_1A5]
MYWADSAHTVGVSEYILELSLKCKLPQANILRAQRLLGTAYGVDRRFPEAIEILERAERSHKEACPEYHEVGASIRHARGQAYHDQGQISKALDKLEYTVKAQTKLQNLDLLAIQHELGRAYLANGQTSAAIETLKHVVKSEEMLPESDPDRLSSQHALGSALYEKGQIPEAIEIGEHVVNVRRESLPEDDQTRLASEHSLAVYYREDGQTSRAVEMLEHVVKVREMLPESHSDRLRSQHELAVAYLEDGQISKAVELLEHVVKLRSMLPESHLDRLKAQHSLAVAHLDNGQISKAVEMLEHVVKLREMLPELHPDQLNSQRELALAYQSNGQINAAMAVWYMVYTVLEAAVPTNHLDLTAAEDRMIRTAHIHASTDAESHHSEKMVCPGIASMLERARARIMSAESTSGHAGSMPSKDSLVEMALRKALMLEQARADSMSAEGTSRYASGILSEDSLVEALTREQVSAGADSDPEAQRVSSSSNTIGEQPSARSTSAEQLLDQAHEQQEVQSSEIWLEDTNRHEELDTEPGYAGPASTTRQTSTGLELAEQSDQNRAPQTMKLSEERLRDLELSSEFIPRQIFASSAKGKEAAGRSPALWRRMKTALRPRQRG